MKRKWQEGERPSERGKLDEGVLNRVSGELTSCSEKVQ